MESGPTSVLAYWLLPAEPARSYFTSIINEFARRLDAPAFDPHVTIYATKKANDVPAEILDRVLTDWQPCRLTIRDVEYSDLFIKTVFVQFDPSPNLTRLSQAFQQTSDLHDPYDFNPHLSLIYKEMKSSAKIDMIASIQLPFDEVYFDMAKAVICPLKTRSRQDVENWRVVAVQRLAK